MAALIFSGPASATQCPPDVPAAMAGCVLDENAVWVRQIKPMDAHNVMALAQAERESRLGRENRARDMLARIMDPAVKAQGIATLFEYQVERGEGPDPELFESMLSRVMEVRDEARLSNVLARMAVVQVRAGIDADLARYPEAVEGAVPRGQIRLRITRSLGEAERFDEALETIKAITAPEQQAVAYKEFAQVLLEAGNEDWAFALPNIVDDPKLRNAALQGLIESYARTGNTGVVLSRFPKWEAAEENTVLVKGFRRHVAGLLAGQGEIDTALELVAPLEDPAATDLVRSAYAVHRGKTESLKAAEMEIGHVESPIVRVNTALALAAHFGGAGFKQAGLRMADTALRTLPNEWEADPLARAFALQRAIPVLVDLGDLDRAEETLALLEEEVRGNPATATIRVDWTGDALWKIALDHASRGTGADGLKVLLSRKTNISEHDRIRLALAAGSVDGALQVARNIEAMGPRAHGHLMIVDHLLEQVPGVPATTTY